MNTIKLLLTATDKSQFGKKSTTNSPNPTPEILFITSYPPRECGIATYSQDLIKALRNKFNKSFKLEVCALETVNEQHIYPEKPKFILNTSEKNAFKKLAFLINKDDNIQLVVIQHEFGFYANNEEDLNTFLAAVNKPIVFVFHTILPNPNPAFKSKVKILAAAAAEIIVMTHSAATILEKEYGIASEKLSVIPHGTHLVQHLDKDLLKYNYNLLGKKILSTFGLLGSGKSIETTLEALPLIVKDFPEVLFLIIGKTHPNIVKKDGEAYRNMLEDKIADLNLQKNVKFINNYLPTHELLDYLQLSDIYLFTSKDPNQAVSGTFAYAMSCGCPIISTPIPHAKEVLDNNSGIIVDFQNPKQLAEAVVKLLESKELRNEISSKALHKMASTAWENSANAHAILFQKTTTKPLALHYKLPEINLDHIKKLSDEFGMIQFSKINQPDIETGYTIDDNARALVSLCQYLEIYNDTTVIPLIKIYYDYIKYCQQSDGSFLNYVNISKQFTEQNTLENLEDSNGRTIWALGYLLSVQELLPKKLIEDAQKTFEFAQPNALKIHSTRAMAFMIKGLYYSLLKVESKNNLNQLITLANRLVQMYRHEADEEWSWYESYLTYGNSILPEAMLCAYLATKDETYKNIAKSSFDFLLSKIFINNQIQVISNKGWLHKGKKQLQLIGGEQPIDVAYTVIALQKFHLTFKKENYDEKLIIAFNWFLGKNALNQIIYNPCTGGCYDGLEEKEVNLNQGAESTVSYLMARLALEKQLIAQPKKQHYTQLETF